jgi:hypothetical protein
MDVRLTYVKIKKMLVIYVNFVKIFVIYVCYFFNLSYS